MRLTLLALIGVLCLACSYALETEENGPIGLLDVADQGAYHANEGDRAARHGHGGWKHGRHSWHGGHGGRHGGHGWDDDWDR